MSCRTVSIEMRRTLYDDGGGAERCPHARNVERASSSTTSRTRRRATWVLRVLMGTRIDHSVVENETSGLASSGAFAPALVADRHPVGPGIAPRLERSDG